jgi:hypothetical protein
MANGVEQICTGCGERPGDYDFKFTELCGICARILTKELELRFRQGPRFGSTYGRLKDGKDSSIGVGLYISKTPIEAMAEATRIAEHNGWSLLRLDIQSSLIDIYVSSDYNKYFPWARKMTALPFNAEYAMRVFETGRREFVPPPRPYQKYSLWERIKDCFKMLFRPGGHTD